MKIQKPVTAILALLLASCTTLATVPTLTTTLVATVPFTETAAPPSPTLTRTSTVTPEPSATLTSTPDLSIPYSDTLFTKKLSALVVKPDDVPRLSPEFPQVMDPNYPRLIQPKVQDSTREINNCEKDCVKVVWTSKKVEGTGDSQVILVMIRNETAQKAVDEVAQSFTKFSQVEPDMNFEEGDIYYPDQLPKNSKVGVRFKEPDVEIMFTASRGPVYLMVIYHFQTELEFNLDFGSVQNLAILQLSKLEAAGYPE